MGSRYDRGRSLQQNRVDLQRQHEEVLLHHPFPDLLCCRLLPPAQNNGSRPAVDHRESPAVVRAARVGPLRHHTLRQPPTQHGHPVRPGPGPALTPLHWDQAMPQPPRKGRLRREFPGAAAPLWLLQASHAHRRPLLPAVLLQECRRAAGHRQHHPLLRERSSEPAEQKRNVSTKLRSLRLSK